MTKPRDAFSPALEIYFLTYNAAVCAGWTPKTAQGFRAKIEALTSEDRAWLDGLSEELHAAYASQVAKGPPSPTFALRATDPRGIYVASKACRASMWQALRAGGAPIVSTWIDKSAPTEASGWSELYARALREATETGAFVIYSEPGDVLKGALAEMGAALAFGVPVFWVGPRLNCTAHPGITVCGSLEEAMERAKAVLAEGAETPAARDGVEQPFTITADAGDRRGLILCTVPGRELLRIAPDEAAAYGHVVAQGYAAYKVWHDLWCLLEQGGSWGSAAPPSPGITFWLDGEEYLCLEAERVVRAGVVSHLFVTDPDQLPKVAWDGLCDWLALALHALEEEPAASSDDPEEETAPEKEPA